MIKLPVREQLWRWAIEDWRRGDGATVEGLLLDRGAIPAFARAWLADALAGRVKRKRGPRPRRDVAHMYGQILTANRVRGAYDRHYQQAVLDGASGGTPTERAIAAVAAELGMPESAVSRWVFPRNRGGKAGSQGA